MYNFYIYIYLDPRKYGKYVYGDYCFLFEPFYVGKGKGKRLKVLSGRNDHFKNKFNKIKRFGFDPIVIKVKENIINEESKKLEKQLIKLIGREDLGKGPLVNWTDGGEGSSGYICSDETRESMSEKKKGENNSNYGKGLFGKNNPMFGRYHSEKTRKLMRENHADFKGENGPFYGKHHSEESNKKQSEKLKEKFKNGELNILKGENHPMYKKQPSEKTRKLISEKLKGENGPNSILTEKNVIEIRIDLKEGILTQKEISEKFGVNSRTISNIKCGKTWKYIKLEDI